MTVPKGSSLGDLCEAVADERSFLVFVRRLIEDRQAHDRRDRGAIDGPSGPGAGWQHHDIAAFLEAAEAWAVDTRFGRSQPDFVDNPWRQFARFLWCGKIYE